MHFQLILSFLTLASTVSAHCTRPQLIEAVDSYMSAQSGGSINTFKTRFDNSTWLGYYENSKKIDVNMSILNTALTITHNRSIYDTTGCASFTELIINNASAPYVIGTMLKFANHHINKVDTLVTKPGDWFFNITGYQYWTSREDWSPIPSDRRDSYQTLKAAADAYADRFNNTSISVPFGIPCDRLEGGRYIQPGLANDTCAVGIPTGITMTDRQYVVDEEMGSVDLRLNFNGKYPDSHHFRVENGKIRFVHTMTVCDVPNCNLTLFR